jgi:hypothetical protein
MPTMPALSLDLRRLLECGLPTEDVAERIGSNPVLRAEAERHLPALREYAVRVSGEYGVKKVIGRRFALYPQPDRSEVEWAAWWDDYISALQDVPLESLEGAMEAYIREPGSEFLPRPGKLRELAFLAQTKGAAMYQRAKAAVEYRPKRQDHTFKSPEDKARVKAMLADYLGKVGKPPPPPAPRPTHGPIGESGLTAEMRAHIAKGVGE